MLAFVGVKYCEGAGILFIEFAGTLIEICGFCCVVGLVAILGCGGSGMPQSFDFIDVMVLSATIFSFSLTSFLPYELPSVFSLG